MPIYDVDPHRVLTDDEKHMLEEAKNLPIIYDDDSPELTPEELAQFRRISQENRSERNKVSISLRLSPKAVRTAKSLGKGYTSVLSRILEDVLSDSDSLRHYL